MSIMAREDFCTQEDISQLVHQFYDRIRLDEVLGPIFNEHIDDWDEHLEIMVRFWSSILLGSGTYSGAPMPKHIALPDLNAGLFERWLRLFHETTLDLDNELMGQRANALAQRIARSLWLGYQLHNSPQTSPKDLHHV